MTDSKWQPRANFIDRRDLGVHMTFAPDKKRPIFNWMYYKEAFSSTLVRETIRELGMAGPILDPFVGVGTVPLECKYNGIASVGRDASPVAVLASTVKTRNYAKEELDKAMLECSKIIERKSERPRMDWMFELFRPDLVLPQRNLQFIKQAREHIESIGDARVRDFLLLGLISILPQCTYLIKDGGVLKIAKNKRAADARALFKKKVRRMCNDVATYGVVYDEPDIQLGSATSINLPDNSVGGIITSPPYINNVDYTKVYGLELSLYNPNLNPKDVRKSMVRSFIRKGDAHIKVKSDYVMNILVGSLGHNIPLLAYAYFTDMLQVLRECKRVMAPGAVCSMVVGNAVLERAHIECDAILAKMAEDEGMECEIWVGSFRHADVPVKGKLPVRESAVIMRKSA